MTAPGVLRKQPDADPTDAEIERLISHGYDWHSAYRRALTDRHLRDFKASRLTAAPDLPATR